MIHRIALLVGTALLATGLTVVASSPAEAAAPVVTASASMSAAPAAVSDRQDRPKLKGTSLSFDTHWWGWSHNFGPYGTALIINAINSGAGASGIAALFCSGTIVGVPCGVAFGVAAALLAIGSSLISTCARNGRGFTVLMPWVAGVPYCRSR